MKKIFPILFSFLGILSFSQQVSLETLLSDKISIRALEVYDKKVWYSGTDSKFGFVDIKNPQHQKQIKLSEKKLQFRTLAQDKNSFYLINIESPAEFFKINKKDLTSEIIFRDTVKTAFYDALHFVNNELAYTFSDANKDNRLKLAVFKNGKWNSFKNNIILNEGEAAFAASNTNIVSAKKYLWIATGGKVSRILRMNLKNDEIEAFNTPFIQGESSQGMYSIDFYDEQFGIAVGGDYTKQADNINNIATTNDGGKTWQIQASGKNAGYTTCVKIKPNSKGKEIISVGDQHISYSSDFGKTWKKISDEKGFFVCEWVDGNTVVLAGKDRIAKMSLK
ncbi:WD40/YVTN/BNR-like repeat-containing protein [Chryseobacterium gwangjuense]|uniref:WD40/YVTN/BNR-like repeat-containing protein n=1 Tax=Chryseobacterium gwangjuense TaxID=1069980 RepID=UPI001E3C0FA9|nr:glycosyl hydrolase [Chryseobacterium gwangjuense]MCE3076126.1 glycosyl hydrolase [Chryseobacterium gwangjuense]